MGKRKPWQNIALYLFVFVLCIIILYPYFVMFITSAKTNEEMYAVDHVLPNVWQWSNFTDIWTAAPVFRTKASSLVLSSYSPFIKVLT